MRIGRNLNFFAYAASGTSELRLTINRLQFFVRQKVQISSKILPQIPSFANFVKFRQKSIFSSRRPVFVISSVFRQKRNPLEPNDK